jgi:Zn-dependent peptidase ImmA (M78 family)
MYTFKSFLIEEMYNQQLNNIVKTFIPYCRKELRIKNLPNIKFLTDLKFSSSKGSFGMYDDKTKTIFVTVKNRQAMDILRTLAHELAHYSFHVRKITYSRDKSEDEATKLAGIIIKTFANTHSNIFNLKSF